jgi:ATP-dependent helicase HrpB
LLAVLHGTLSPDEQQRALAACEQTKVILATNLAESSLTVPGVRVVIDAGLERVASDSAWSGIRTLETRPISRASATQRAGRAGRLGPGRCLRLYTRRDHDSRPERADPEIGRLNLASLVLSLRAAGISDPASLAWLDAPPETALHSAEQLLV